MFSSDKVNELFTSLSKAQGEFKSIPFDKKNPHFNSKYASLSATLDATREVLSKNGLSVIQSVQTDDNGYFVCTRLCHSSGQFIASTLKLIIDKNNMQGLGSAVTYAKRYGLQAMLGIAGDEDDDGNAASAQSKSEKPKEDPREYVLNLGSIKNTKLKDIPPDKLNEVALWLKGEIQKDSKSKQGKFFGFVYGNIKKVLETGEVKKKADVMGEKKTESMSPDIPPDFVLDNNSQQEGPNPFEDFAQTNESSTQNDLSQYVIKVKLTEISDLFGKQLKNIHPRDLSTVVAILDSKINEVPKIANVTDVFVLKGKIQEYLKSIGV